MYYTENLVNIGPVHSGVTGPHSLHLGQLILSSFQGRQMINRKL